MKLKWHDAPTRTQWGHDMVVATVALGKDHSVDLYCERSKTAEAEALLKKPWVGLTDEEITKTYWSREPFKRPTPIVFAREIEQLLKEKNNGTTP
jgi:hypothetical protein